MDIDPREELISAYLDGELTAEEKHRVERLLTESAEHRQLYEELRALRGTFAQLPRYRLPEDLSQRVLRRAEQELLRRPVADAKGGSGSSGKSAAKAVEDPALAGERPQVEREVPDDRPTLRRAPGGPCSGRR